MACLFGHKWNGCKCRKCGNTRDEGHVWNGCICSICGKEVHIYSKYKCSKCGKIDLPKIGSVNEDMINQMTDLAVLMKIAKDYLVVPMRKAAIARRTRLIENLTDNTTLVNIVYSEDEYIYDNRFSISTNFRETAVRSITDQAALAKIAQDHKYSSIRSMAVRYIEDQLSLKRIFKKDTDRDVRKAALHRLTGQSFLMEIAKTSTDSSFREIAVAKLSDLSIVEDIAKSDADSSVRRAAIAKLSDQTVLAKIAKSDIESNVRRAAISKLSDQSFLAEIANLDNDTMVCAAALQKITDPDIVLSVARGAASDYAKKEAMKKLGGYFCESCRFENLPENGQPVTCVCKSCKAENHDFKEMYNTTTLPGHAERNESWEMCVRCSLTKNHTEGYSVYRLVKCFQA